MVKTRQAAKEKPVYLFSTREAPNEKLSRFSLKWNQNKFSPSCFNTDAGFLLTTSDQKKGCC